MLVIVTNESILNYFQGIKRYVRGNDTEIWIETEYLVFAIKATLGSLFYSVS
jgi:hypothetical protein